MSSQIQYQSSYKYVAEDILFNLTEEETYKAIIFEILWKKAQYDKNTDYKHLYKKIYESTVK